MNQGIDSLSDRVVLFPWSTNIFFPCAVLAVLWVFMLAPRAVTAVEAVSAEGETVEGRAVEEEGNVQKPSEEEARWRTAFGLRLSYDTNVTRSEKNAKSGVALQARAGGKYNDDRPERLLNIKAAASGKYLLPLLGAASGIGPMAASLNIAYENRGKARALGIDEDFGFLSSGAEGDNPAYPTTISNGLDLFYRIENRNNYWKPGVDTEFRSYSSGQNSSWTGGGMFLDAGVQRWWLYGDADYIVYSSNAAIDGFVRLEILGGMREADPGRRKRLDYNFGIGFVYVKPMSSNPVDSKFDVSCWLKLDYDIEKNKKKLLAEIRRKVDASTYSYFQATNRLDVSYRYFFKDNLAWDLTAYFQMLQPENKDSVTQLGAVCLFRWKPFRGKTWRDMEFNFFGEFSNQSSSLADLSYSRFAGGAGAEYTF